MLFCDAKRWAVVRDVVDALPDLEHVFVIGPRRSPTGRPAPASTCSRRPIPGTLPGDEVAEDDLLAILYTSGTTGKPKGATITHRQAIANLQNMSLLGAIAGEAAEAAAPEPTCHRTRPCRPRTCSSCRCST